MTLLQKKSSSACPAGESWRIEPTGEQGAIGASGMDCRESGRRADSFALSAFSDGRTIGFPAYPPATLCEQASWRHDPLASFCLPGHLLCRNPHSATPDPPFILNNYEKPPC
jgi:hypothetical protein